MTRPWQVSIRVEQDHLEAILENAEWSLRFAEAFERGDPLGQVPRWPTVEEIRRELGFSNDPLSPEPLEGLTGVKIGDTSYAAADPVAGLVEKLRSSI
jgi:hypothetical protein